LGVAYRNFNGESFSKDDETKMTFLGYLALFDPPKAGIADTLKELRALSVTTKMIATQIKLSSSAIAGLIQLLNRGDRSLE
jgi:Mg2+-importing ATPase